MTIVFGSRQAAEILAKDRANNSEEYAELYRSKLPGKEIKRHRF